MKTQYTIQTFRANKTADPLDKQLVDVQQQFAEWQEARRSVKIISLGICHYFRYGPERTDNAKRTNKASETNEKARSRSKDSAILPPHLSISGLFLKKRCYEFIICEVWSVWKSGKYLRP